MEILREASRSPGLGRHGKEEEKYRGEDTPTKVRKKHCANFYFGIEKVFKENEVGWLVLGEELAMGKCEILYCDRW